MLIYLFLVYYVIIEVPLGVVETSFVDNVLTVGDYVEVLPKYVDMGSMCVVQRNGMLVFKFNEFSSSF
jgi:hypothetical protein